MPRAPATRFDPTRAFPASVPRADPFGLCSPVLDVIGNALDENPSAGAVALSFHNLNSRQRSLNGINTGFGNICLLQKQDLQLFHFGQMDEAGVADGGFEDAEVP